MGDAQLLKENRELKRLLQKTEDEKKALKDQIRAYESQLHRLQVRTHAQTANGRLCD